MKKVLTLIMALLMLMAAGCSAEKTDGPALPEGEGAASENTGVTIGVSYYEMAEFTNLVQSAMIQEAERLGVKLVDSNAQWDAAVQMSQLEDMISMGVDAIILLPTDSDAMVPAISMCEEAGVPLVVVNNSLNTDQPYYYIGANEAEAGEMEARAMAEAMGGEGNIVILQCILGTGYEVGRTLGYEKVFGEYPGINVLDAQPANGQRDAALDLMENWIEAYGDNIDAVLTQCDEMAMGALIAAESANLTDLVVVGIDGTQDGMLAVRDGKMAMTCMQDANYEGINGLRVALGLINGEEPAVQQDIIDMIPVDASNVGAFLQDLYGIE